MLYCPQGHFPRAQQCRRYCVVITSAARLEREYTGQKSHSPSEFSIVHFPLFLDK